MFKIKRVKELQGMDTVVGFETVIKGEIQCHGCLRIDGNVNGDIKVEGDIYVGDSAVITGNITAYSITIGGVVEGNITTSGILRILSTAKLIGDIKVNGFIADEGGTFIGRCYMIKPPQKVLEAMFIEKRNNETTMGNIAINE
jgi:Integral membrane protein CcmA involved in cell shape determination